MCGNKAGSITRHTSRWWCLRVRVHSRGVKHSACVRVSMSVCRLISRVCGEGHGFNQVPCHLARNGCKFPTPARPTHGRTDTFSVAVDPRIGANPRVALKVLGLLVLAAGSSTWAGIFRQIIHHRGAKSTSTNPQRPEREVEDKFVCVRVCPQACVYVRMCERKRKKVCRRGEKE